MTLDHQLALLQKKIHQAWQQAAQNDKTALSFNEFEYLRCVHEAENSVPEELVDEHDNSTHLSSLAADMNVKKSSASIMLAKLEKRGWVERVTCRYDARAQHILLTEQGRTLYLEAHAEVYQGLAEVIAQRLGGEDTTRLSELLAKVLD